MKNILYLKTQSMQCDPHVQSIREIGEKASVTTQSPRYYPSTTFTHIIVMGALDSWYGPKDFKMWRENGSKVIFYCCEASNPDWWPRLDEIKNSVDLIVNIDGNDTYKDAYTTLAIYGQAVFFKSHFFWEDRPIPVGFCGGSNPNGTTRRDNLLRHFDPQRLRSGPYPLMVNYPFIELPGTYHLYAEFLLNTRFIINASGSAGDKSNHVKGRVLEAGLAGCCLLEDSQSPIGKWFSDDCYYKYNDPLDCELIIRDIANYPEEAKKRAMNLQREVINNYNPKKLWNQIFELCG